MQRITLSGFRMFEEEANSDSKPNDPKSMSMQWQPQVQDQLQNIKKYYEEQMRTSQQHSEQRKLKFEEEISQKKDLIAKLQRNLAFYDSTLSQTRAQVNALKEAAVRKNQQFARTRNKQREEVQWQGAMNVKIKEYLSFLQNRPYVYFIIGCFLPLIIYL